MPKATIREDNENQVDVALAQITASTKRALAEEIGSEIDQLFLADTHPTRLVIEISYEGGPHA